ncbi:MAG: tetratricopeptide repeat protein [Chitinophagia bacterium]|nr:tetratricopeptide repeat protein [Chitinophagia bacterium]
MPLSVSNATANYYYGLCLLETDNAVQAAHQFEKYPEDPANISGMARVAFMNKDVAKGNTIVKDLAAKAKKKDYLPLVYAADAIAYTEGGDKNQAIEWYKQALAKNPSDVAAHNGIGDVYAKMTGGGGEAMNNYEAITEKDATNSLVLTSIGNLWYLAKNYTKALEYYGKAKDADNANPLPYRSLADAYRLTQKYDLALQNIKKYLELSDNDLNDRITYTEILYQAKDYCNAVKQAQELLNGNLPKDKKTTVIGILGFSESECGDSIDAQKNIAQYLSLRDPKFITPYTYIEYGKLWLKLGNNDSAAYYYAKGISADTARDKTEIYRQIAEKFKARKEYCKAAEWYDNLIKSNPTTQPLDHYWCTVMYYYCKDYANGVNAGKRFTATHADQPSAFYWYGKLIGVTHPDADDVDALNAFAKYLELIGEAGLKEAKKKTEISTAYQYMLLHYYNKKDKDMTAKYTAALKELDPEADILKQLDAANAPQPKQPTKQPAKGGK